MRLPHRAVVFVGDGLDFRYSQFRKSGSAWVISVHARPSVADMHRPHRLRVRVTSKRVAIERIGQEQSRPKSPLNFFIYTITRRASHPARSQSFAQFSWVIQIDTGLITAAFYILRLVSSGLGATHA